MPKASPTRLIQTKLVPRLLCAVTDWGTMGYACILQLFALMILFKEQRIAQATLKAIKPQRLPDLFNVFPACLLSLLPAHAAFRCMSSRDRERSTLLQAAEKLAESPESLPGSGKTGSGCTSDDTRWRGGDTQWLSSRAVSGLLLCTRVCSVQKVRARIDTFILKARRAKVDHLQVRLSRLSVDAIS